MLCKKYWKILMELLCPPNNPEKNEGLGNLEFLGIHV